MPEITTRAGKGTTVTHNEMDANFKRTPVAKSALYTTTSAHNREIHECTGTFTVTLEAAATIAAAVDTGDWRITIKNVSSGTITIARSSTDTIDGATSLTLAQYESVTIALNAAGGSYYKLSTDFFDTSNLLALAHGGTGAALSDPGADRVLGWDDSAGAVIFFTPGSGLTTSTTTLLPDYGSSANTVCEGNDSRLTDSRTCDNTFDTAATARGNIGLGSLAVVYHSVNQTMSAGFNDLSWDTESQDTDAIHDTVTNNNRLTVPSGWTKIQLIANLRFNAIGSGQSVSGRFAKNASATTFPNARQDALLGNSGDPSLMLVSAPLAVTSGDYFTVQVDHSQSNKEVIGGLDQGSWFAMILIE